MRNKILIACFLLASTTLHAENRVWRNSKGGMSIFGQFVKRDETTITIRRSNKSEVIIPIAEMNKDDLAWLNKKHPAPVAKPLSDANCVFDKLQFGDTREQVMTKLKTSKLVKCTLPETMLGRTGLNGVYKTLRKVGELDASLYFDWSEDDKLNEITLQSTSFAADDAEARLTPCWNEFIKQLTSLYGPPTYTFGKLNLTSIADASMDTTHLWKLKDRGTAMLGAARMDNKYQIAVRFTTEDIKNFVTTTDHTPDISTEP